MQAPPAVAVLPSPSSLTGLALLRARIRAAGLPGKHPEKLLLATWNVRELGKAHRSPEALAMLAELIACFDLVSIVELRENVADLRAVLGHLGPSWSTVFSDYVRDAGGNHERACFVFDQRRVAFTGLASHAEPPRKRQGDEYVRALPWWRPPFLASFAAGRFDFVVMTAHVRWGSSVRAREAELVALGDWARARVREPFFGDKDLFLVGDFNLARQDSPAYQALGREGFAVAPGLEKARGTDLSRGKRYDQILYLPSETRGFTGKGGVVDFYAGNGGGLFPERRLTKARFTFELSDHLPLWAELGTTEYAPGDRPSSEEPPHDGASGISERRGSRPARILSHRPTAP